MSGRFRLALVCVALLVAAALPSAARAANTEINFDNLPAGTVVTDQYAAEGVRFGPPGAFGLPAPPVQCPSIVRDEGIHGRSLDFSCTVDEVHAGTNTAMEFEDPRKQVNYTLRNNDYTGTRTVTITEYKVNHEVILQTTAQLPAKAAVPISFAARPNADIAYVSIVENEEPSNGLGVYVDDISAPIEGIRTAVFTLALTEPTAEIVEAGVGTVPVSVRRFGGSTGGVTFSAGPLPPGVTGVQFEPNPVAGRDPSTMRISLGHNVHSDLQVPIQITSTGAPGVGTGATTTGVVTVHPVPALSINAAGPTGAKTIVPGCTGGDPTYFSVRGGLSGTVGITARVVSDGPVLPSPDPLNINIHGDGAYPFEFPFRALYPEGDPRATGTTVVRYTLNPGFGDSAIEGDQTIRSLPVRVADITRSFPDFSSGIVVRGTLPYTTCHFKFVDDLGQEYAITSSSVENGQDVLGLRPPAGFAAVSADNGLRILAPDGKTVLGRTPPISVSSFRNTYGLRQANAGAGAGSTMFPWADFVSEFGDDDAYACFIGCVKDPVAVNYWEKWLGRLKTNPGLCFGYSVTALRFHGYNETLIKASAYEPGARNAYAITNFADGSAIKRDIVRWHYSQKDKAYQEETKRPFAGPASMAQRVVQWKERVHSLIRLYGGALVVFFQGTAGHAVVATRVTDNPDGGFTLALYDPNAPYTLGEQTNTEVRANALASSTIVVKGDGTWSGSSLEWKGDLTSLMFPQQWPTGQAKLPSNLSLESWLDATVTSIKVDGKETLKPSGVPIDAGGPVAIQSDWSGGKDDYEYSLDKGHTYDVELRQDGGGGSFSDVGLGSSTVLDTPGAKAGQVDHVTVTPGQPQLTYDPGADTGNVTLHVVDAGGAKVRHTADVTLDTSGGKPDQVKLAGDTLTVAHAGAPTKVTIALGSLGSGMPEGGLLTAIRLGTGQKLELKPSWGSLSSGIPYVVRDAKGRIIRRGTARLRPSHALKLGSLAATRKGDKAIVSGKVTKGGRSPLLAVSAEALSAGGKVVARKSASLEGARVRSGRKYKLAVKLPKVPHGGKLRLTATLLDQEAGLEAGVATKSIVLGSAGAKH